MNDGGTALPKITRSILQTYLNYRSSIFVKIIFKNSILCSAASTFLQSYNILPRSGLMYLPASAVIRGAVFLLTT